MTAEAPPAPARLVLTTAAGPLEVAAAAATAAAQSRGVLTSEVREEAAGQAGVDFLVTSPLARQPSLRLRVSWCGQTGPGLLVTLEVDDVLGELPRGSARAARAHRAVDRFVEVLEQLISR